MARVSSGISQTVLIAVWTVAACMVAPWAATQTAPPDELSEWSVDGGGGTFSSGVFQITGTFGQPDCEVLVGAAYELEGGLWHSLSPAVPVELVSFEVVADSNAPSEPEAPTREE